MATKITRTITICNASVVLYDLDAKTTEEKTIECIPKNPEDFESVRVAVLSVLTARKEYRKAVAVVLAAEGKPAKFSMPIETFLANAERVSDDAPEEG